MPKRPAGVRKKSPRAYHHGDLKAALVVAATEILRRDGAEALTLRAVAGAAGVSATATYRHFADRRQLMAAVAEAGFQALGRHMQERMLAAFANPRQALRAMAVAYVAFGHEHPAEYRVMFGAEVAHTEDLPALRETARGVLGGVAQAIAGLQRGGLVRPGDAMMIATATWSLLHGLVMLSLDGQIAEGAPSLDALVHEATEIMMFGMAPRSSEPVR